jgi:antirestriction protein
MNKETTLTVPTLTGDELLTKIAEMREVNATNSDIAHACGYTKPNGNPAFVEFYTAMIDAKGPDFLKDDEVTFEEGSLAEKLAETYPAEAIQAFCDYWSADDLEYFEDAYHGEWESGADFAKDLVEGCYDCDALNLPYWVTVRFDWEETWDNLQHDYIELDGFIFSLHW